MTKTEVPTKTVPQVLVLPDASVTSALLAATFIALQSPVLFWIERSTWSAPFDSETPVTIAPQPWPETAGVGVLKSIGGTM